MYCCMREGAVWSWQSFEDQSSERRGPGTETEQAGRQNARMWRAELKSVRNWIKREKWGPDGAQNNRNITCWVFSLKWIT